MITSKEFDDLSEKLLYSFPKIRNDRVYSIESMTKCSDKTLVVTMSGTTVGKFPVLHVCKFNTYIPSKELKTDRLEYSFFNISENKSIDDIIEFLIKGTDITINNNIIDFFSIEKDIKKICKSNKVKLISMSTGNGFGTINIKIELGNNLGNIIFRIINNLWNGSFILEYVYYGLRKLDENLLYDSILFNINKIIEEITKNSQSNKDTFIIDEDDKLTFDYGEIYRKELYLWLLSKIE